MKRTLFTLLVLLSAACGRDPRVHQIRNLGDTPYQEDTIRVTYGYDPDRALVLLDSAVLLGNIDPYHALLARATIYSRAQQEPRLREAQTLCEQLLQHDSVVGVPQRQSAVLDLLVNTTRMTGDDEAYIRWATQKAGLCREMGDEVEALRTQAEIAVAMASLGQVEEALDLLDGIIGQLDRPGSINRMDALSIAVKRKIHILNDQARPWEVIPLPRRMLSRLDHYEQHSDDYAEDSYRLSWSRHPADRGRYLDFTRGQSYAFLANAYATFRTDSALYFLDRLGGTDYGRTLGARKMIVPAQMALGRYREALATYDIMERQMGADTLNSDYAAILRDRGIAARALGQPERAYDYMHRYALLTRELSDLLQAGEAQDYAARYHAKEQELEIERAHGESRTRGMVLALALLLLLIASWTGRTASWPARLAKP